MCYCSKPGGILCWGDNSYGQIGNGATKEWGEALTPIIGLEKGTTAVSAGFGHTCAITSEGGALSGPSAKSPTKKPFWLNSA